MIERAVCLDTSVIIKWLTPETPLVDDQTARDLVHGCMSSGRVVAPAFAWAEVGSVLRKKVRQSFITSQDASLAWAQFGSLPIEFVDDPDIRDRTWIISQALELPTLYDASFMACCEIISSRSGQTVELFTADLALLRQLQSTPYTYVKDFRTAA